MNPLNRKVVSSLVHENLVHVFGKQSRNVQHAGSSSNKCEKNFNEDDSNVRSSPKIAEQG